MQQSIYKRNQWKLFNISSMWDTKLSVFCITIFSALLSFSNHSIIYFIPICIGIDILILFYAIWRKYRQSFLEMQNDYLLFTELERADTALTELYMREIQRFKIYGEGNRNGTKGISVYICQEINGSPTSYSFFNDESIVLLHKDFDGEEDIDRFSMLHEMVHCIGHSLIGLKQIATRLQSTFLVLIIAVFSVLTHSWWILFIGIFLWMVLWVISNSIYVKSRIEMGADAMACMIFEHLYGKERMMKMAKIFTKKYADEILDSQQNRGLCNYGYLLNVIYGISRFMSEDNKNDYVAKLNNRLVSEKEYASDNKVLMKRIEIVRNQILKAPRIESITNMNLTWNSGWYYLLFPLLMIIAWLATYKVIQVVVIPWWCVFFCIVPVLLIVFVKKKAIRTVIKKTDFIQNIINK